jgi:hypothetical protein
MSLGSCHTLYRGALHPGRYTRLEVLEAVSAYHAGDLATAEALLQSAQARWASLQVARVGG